MDSVFTASARSTALHKYRRPLLVLLFLGVLLAAFQLSGLRAQFDLEFLRLQLQENWLTGLLLFIVLFALGNLIHIPGWIFLAAAVLALGQTWGGLATYLAATISCSITFFTIRWLGGDALRLLKNRYAIRLLSHLDERPVRSIFLLRCVLQTAPPLNYALALSGVRFRHYLLGSLLGLPVPITFYCVFFDYLVRALNLAP
jgi:uncharacterized membrane protein YdjX (TVP38/TMEM64 family)